MSIPRNLLTDAQWARLGLAFQEACGHRGRKPSEEANRLFLDALLWIGRAGAPWRDLPSFFGKWRSVHCRFFRLAKRGVFKRMHEFLASPDSSILFMDSTVCKAAPCAAGARKKSNPKRLRGDARSWATAAADSRPRSTPSPTPRAACSTSS